MTRYLPPGYRCTAYWYAARAGLLAGDADLDFLLEFGLQAARRARWHGIREQRVQEGPYLVHTWPEEIWSETADAMAWQVAGITAGESRILAGAYGPDEPVPIPPGERAEGY